MSRRSRDRVLAQNVSVTGVAAGPESAAASASEAAAAGNTGSGSIPNT
jgi:hypothetical protein